MESAVLAIAAQHSPGRACGAKASAVSSPVGVWEVDLVLALEENSGGRGGRSQDQSQPLSADSLVAARNQSCPT
jgi:hypothetical protein